jgi:hypothetical protein
MAMDKAAQGQVDRLSDGECSTAVAQAIEADFRALIRVLDGQLARLSEADSRKRPHITDAKSAAERGLSLSRKLLSALQKAQ